ncbi:MAG TPA: RpiB/LacA/LacB family sugar-phosphate isomerase [Blastocatellia bacterium]|nr:RpiB/LacA/LacB family sugar-phosphate isomerase [Blastocatellia bacterium]
MQKKVLTESDLAGVRSRSRIYIPPETIVTPSARDAAAERHIEIIRLPARARETIALGADHAGFSLKEEVKKLLVELGYDFHDFGTYDDRPVDYPDIAYKVAAAVSRGEYGRGIILDGAGIGSAIVANKLPGVRAAPCYDAATARNSREHNDANILTLGARLIDPIKLREIIPVWLSSTLTEERHRRRVEKILDIERKHLRGESR